MKAGIKNNPSLLTPIDKPKIINAKIPIFFLNLIIILLQLLYLLCKVDLKFQMLNFV